MPAGRLDRRHFLTLAGIVAGTVLAWGAFFLFLPAAGPAAETAPAERLARAAALLAWPALLVLAMIVAVALARFATGAFDPLKDAEGRFQRVTQRVLTNTVEQVAVFGPALLAASVLMEAGRLPALSVAAGLFVAGRLLFWAGYLLDPLHRSIGMVVTMNVNAGLLAYCLWRLAGG